MPRKSHGEVAGIPYDFRKPTWERAKQRMWNKDDRRVFTPKSWGIGWTMNFRNPKSVFVLLLIIVLALLIIWFAVRPT